MSAPAADEDATNGCLALAAGLPGALVDAVFQLEKTGGAVCIHVVGD
jgi:hypothetical protein